MKQSKRKPSAEIATAITDVDAASPVLAIATDNGAALLSAVSSVATYALAASCTVRDSGAMRTVLQEVFDAPETVTIDVSALERVDAAALQVLCAFVRDRKTQGRSVEWLGESATFSEAVRLLGLASVLNVPAGRD